MDTRLADAMRYTRQDLDDAIRYARTAMRRGERQAEFLAKYIAEMRRAEGLRLAGEAFNLTGELWQPWAPMPFNDGIVDADPVRKFRRQWDGFCVPAEHHIAPVLAAA